MIIIKHTHHHLVCKSRSHLIPLWEHLVLICLLITTICMFQTILVFLMIKSSGTKILLVFKNIYLTWAVHSHVSFECNGPGIHANNMTKFTEYCTSKEVKAFYSCNVNTHICCICCGQDSNTGLPDVTFVTEQTDSPKLINLVKRSAYVNHNNVHLHLVEFPLQMVAKMHQLLTQIAKYDCTWWSIILWPHEKDPSKCTALLKISVN